MRCTRCVYLNAAKLQWVRHWVKLCQETDIAMQVACNLICLLECLHLVPFYSYFYPLVLPDYVIFCMVLCVLMLSNTCECRCCFLHLSILRVVCCVCTQSTKRKSCLFCCWFELAGTQFRWSIDAKQSALALYCLGWVIYMFSRREVACVSCLLQLAETTVEVPYTRMLFLLWERNKLRFVRLAFAIPFVVNEFHY